METCFNLGNLIYICYRNIFNAIVGCSLRKINLITTTPMLFGERKTEGGLKCTKEN